MRNYTGLSLKILGVSIITLLVFVGLGSLINNTHSLSFQIFGVLVLGYI
jgi:hypothetical protein